jgi:hypothetical protein
MPKKTKRYFVVWFNEFAEEVGPENVCLLMHTDPKDPHGQDLEQLFATI